MPLSSVFAVASVPFSLIIGGILLIGIGDLFLAVREMTLNSRDSVNSDARWLKHDYTGLRVVGWLIIVSGVLTALGGIVMVFFAASSL